MLKPDGSYGTWIDPLIEWEMYLLTEWDKLCDDCRALAQLGVSDIWSIPLIHAAKTLHVPC